jgi:membrane-bound ClpP family serine protease
MTDHLARLLSRHQRASSGRLELLSLRPARLAVRAAGLFAAAVLLSLVALGSAGAAMAQPGAGNSGTSASGDGATDGAERRLPPVPEYRGQDGPVPPGRLANKLAIIPIRTALFEADDIGMAMIDHITARSVKRRIDAAESWGADAIVFEIDTPGGELSAVLDITEAIRGTTAYTIAWVNQEAISGGAIIAIACDEIVAHPDAIFGDAGIVTMAQNLGDVERAKVASPLIADIIDSARRNGYDEVLMQGLTVLNVRLWEVRHAQTGERFFLSESEYRALFNEAPPTGSSPLLGGGATAGASDARQFADRPAREGEGRLEPTRQDFNKAADDITPGMERDILNEMEARETSAPTRPDFNNEDPSDWVYVDYVSAGDNFLTVRSAADLGYLGIASAPVADRAELLGFTQTTSGDVRTFERSTAEWFVKFMTMTTFGLVIQVVLVVVFLLSMFIELSMPGTGVFGITSLVALGLLVLPNILLGMTGWVLLAAVVLGVALILIEVFITPGLGVPGVAGLALLLVGLVGAISSPGAGGVTTEDYAFAGLMVLLAMFVAGAGMYLFTRYTQFVPLANKLVLQSPNPPRDEMLASMGSGAAVDEEARAQVGDEGVAHTRLMPAGTAEVNGELVDAVAERGFIDRGERVRVVSATRYRVSVVRIDAPDPGAADRAGEPEAGEPASGGGEPGSEATA